MKIDDIPQDNSASYHGHRKVIYGTRDGTHEAATSNGWQDEAYATEMAVWNSMPKHRPRAKSRRKRRVFSAVLPYVPLPL